MLARIEHLKDVLNTNYLGIRVQPEALSPFLGQMRQALGDMFDLYAGMQARRDLGTHHISVVTTSEYNSLSERMGIDRWVSSLDRIMDMEFDVTLLGLGAASGGGSKEYFVVVRSESLAELRRSLGLPEKDFTVSLGFYPREVHGVRKTSMLPLRDPFLKLLGDTYYNHNKSFDFLKDMEHFDGDAQDEVVATSIGDTSATLRSGKGNYYTLCLLGDTLGIGARWQGDERPRLSDTVISRKLKTT